MEISSYEFNLRASIAEVTEMFKAMAKNKKIGLECHIEDNLPETWLGDSIRLKQILINLIGNAIKFTARGGVTVTVSRHDGALVSHTMGEQSLENTGKVAESRPRSC